MSSSASPAPVIQVFGTRKCPETRKTLRFLKERGVRCQEIDLSQKGPSAGELRGMAAQLGWPALLDQKGPRFRDKGLSHALLGDPDIERLLLQDPLLLRTPVVRRGRQITVGYAPEAWREWLSS